MLRIKILVFSLLFVAPFAEATNDSLLQQAIQLEYEHPDSAISIINLLIDGGASDAKLLSNAMEVRGIARWVQEDYPQAIMDHSEALRLRQSIGYLSGAGYSYNNLGLNYQALGDAKQAMQHFLDAKDIAEQAEDSSLVAKILGNIGTLYEEQHATEKALEYYEESLKILGELGEDRILANTLNNVALVYKQIDEPEKAWNFAQRSLSIRNMINDKWGVAQSLNLLGVLASDKKDYLLADSLFHVSLAAYDELDNFWGRSMVHGNLGADANAVENHAMAVVECGRSLRIAKKHVLEWEESACQCLAEAYTGLSQADSAGFYWGRLVAIKDSIRQVNALTEISLVQKRFEFEKERLRSEAEIERQRVLRQAAVGLGMMGIALFFVAFRSYWTKQKDNDLLEQKNSEILAKNEVIEEKNLHITDSIRYAERLQAAILPKGEMFAKYFSDFQILYRPKDIVSGDFYWMEEMNGLIYLAAADCTGHGVPGAMVSMVGFQGLNKAVLEERLTSPAAILQRLSDHVEEAFEKSGGSVKDGMDICLVAIDLKKRIVTYAGAHNALWILTSKEELPNANLREEEDGKRMFELKADRRSIGGFMDAGSFTEKVVELNEGDHLFLFSDGFADQFGGPQGKKMGSKRMRETCRQMAVSGNMLALGAIFEDWKAQEEQIDDVTVISVVV